MRSQIDMLKINSNSTSPVWIAPCGINCRLCRAYGRERNPCPGCRVEDASKPKTRLMCRIKTCENMLQGKIEYCFDCGDFPCARLMHLDKRYRTKYGTSVIDNLLNLRKIGIKKFIKNENKKWTCPRCGAMLCMHEPQCLSCGFAWHKFFVFG